jgi:hypothetical protein
MSELTRSLGFTNSIQRLVWPRGNNIPVTAYLWGGGGGGGGNDSGIGGAGSGGGFSKVSFLVNQGDVIDVAVGGAGGGGASNRGSAPGGSAGASFVPDQIFDTRSAVTSPPVIPSTNTAYVSFLNTYGVWVSPTSARNFDRSYVVDFPATGLYTFTASCDNFADIFVDGQLVGNVPGFRDTYALTTNVSAGSRVVRIVAVNTGGPGSVALTIGGGASYSGGQGGTAGPSGSSGGGGGGGGATVIFKNGTPIAVAGGGAGGGGAGNRGTRDGQTAPGTAGQADTSTTSGQNGQQKSGDGGGGGAGGGGAGGGNGGLVRDGDQGAFAGSFGFSLGENTANPIDRNAANRNSEFYVGSAGAGGGTGNNGTSGYAVLTFDVPGIYVHGGTSFQPVQQVWIKDNDVWQEIRGTYIKINDSWIPVQGSQAPDFVKISGNFGVSSRPINPDGGGGGKIICQKLSEMGYFDTEMNRADQLFGVQLQQGDPDAYAGYVRWARPVVVLLEGGGSETLRKFVFFWEKDSQKRKDMQSSIVAYYLDKLARPWAEEMAYRMHAPGYAQSNTAGNFIMNIGLPMCRVIGRWGKDNQWPMWAKTLSIWGTVTVLLVTIVTISTVDKLLGKLRKLIGK